MADNLIFPIRFDLEKAVEQAGKDWDGKFADKLEKLIAKRPVNVKLNIDVKSINDITAQISGITGLSPTVNPKIDTSSFDGALKSLKNSLQSVDYESLTEQEASAIKTLTGAVNSLARAYAEKNKAAALEDKVTQELKAATAVEKRAKAELTAVKAIEQRDKKEANIAIAKANQVRAEENATAATKRRAVAEANLLAAQNRKLITERNLAASSVRMEKAQLALKNAQDKSANATRNASKAYSEQSTYLQRLTQRMAAYWSIRQVGNFLTNVREVTAQFELQRVSLGAIIQDQTRANALFSEIKSFALKSPLKIMDLTKYTKQVAAYGIETEKLFDTTKRLADVSVGLGVDMSRLTLAYGQTKAASYLRAAEIRQYTEAGIPMLELLAEKFTELQGTAVSTEEVMDKVSKRMVSFSMVEEIFKEMTDAGGMFYNMQEKQSQTLYGMWSKLGDAAAIMYNEIGNTSSVNDAMKTTISLTQSAFQHWTAFASVLHTGVIAFASYKAAMAGLIPLYDLNSIQIMNSIKAEKQHQALMSKKLSLFATLTTSQAKYIATQKALTAAEWEEYITRNKLNSISALGLARRAKENAALQKALITQKLYTKEQLAQIQAMTKMQFAWAKVKAGVLGIGNAFKTLGTAIKSFLPLAAITAVLDLFLGWRESISATEDAIEGVNKRYKEMQVTLSEIENAYLNIQKATKEASESEEAFAKTSFSQKIEQLNKIIKLLSQFGLKNTIDLSVLNYENIDPVIENWLEKLKQVNELSAKWGRSLAQVANAYEGNILGLSLFGENLKEDMKDLSRSYTDLTVNPEFSAELKRMRAYVDEMSAKHKDFYDEMSKSLGVDAKLALSQKHRNETELQYQQRILKNYQKIAFVATGSGSNTAFAKMMAKGTYSVFKDINTKEFEADLAEVMHEIRKTISAFEDEDPMTIRMAIDDQFTINEWEDWQKELVIQELNKDRLKIGLDLIPTLSSSATDAVSEGMKAIVSTEFPTLFNEQELKSLVSVDAIYDAIKAKLDASNESLEKNVQLQNNIAYGSKGFGNSLNRVKKLQDEITEAEQKRVELVGLQQKKNKTSEELLRQSQLEMEVADISDEVLNTKRKQISAIVEANAKYDEQIKKQRESAEAEREIAKAALDRVSSMGLSDLGKDVKGQFSGLMVDAVKEMTDKNYSTDFLISDDEIKKVRDVGDLYETWAKNTKAIKDEKEKLVGVGITEATIEKERAALEEKRAKIQLQLSAVEKEITDKKIKGQETEYAKLKLALANATTAEAQKKAQENLNKFLGDTKNAEFAILMLKKEGLKTALQETLVSEAANTQISDYLKGLDNAENLWEELGKRYNFRLQDKGNKGRGGSGEDPWILLMKNRMKFMQDFQKGVEDLNKVIGYSGALSQEQETMKGRGLSLKIDTSSLTGTKDELMKWYEDTINEIQKKIAKLGGKEWEGLGVQMILAKDTKSRVIKSYQDLLQSIFKEMTDFKTDKLKEDLERKLKVLSDRVSRTKTAQEFYNKILSTTGDLDLAANVTMSIYGDAGTDVQGQMANYIRELFGKYDIQVPVNIISKDGEIDYTAMEKYVRENEKILGDGYKELIKIAQDGQKNMAKTYEGYLKDLEVAKTFADKRIELARDTANKINEIERERVAAQKKLDELVASGNTDKDTQDEIKRLEAKIKAYSELPKQYEERENREAAKLEYEAFKDSPLYVQMFEDLEYASTSALTRMREKLVALKGEWKNLDPTQLKEMQKRLEEIDNQLATRNPFSALIKSIKKWRELRKEGRTRKGDEEKAFQTEEEREIKKREMLDAEAAYQLAVKQSGEQSEIAKNAKKEADAKKDAYKDAENAANQASKQAEEWEEASEAIDHARAALKKYQEQLNVAFDGIKDIMGAFGASAEDMQFFDDMVGGFNKIMDSADLAMSSFKSFRTGDYLSGITSAVGAIGGIISGFTSLFTAGRVRKANKEIKRQQELIDQLQYAYDRLEDKADKVFGKEFLSNYDTRLRNLQAQQTAYLKQAEAERSKGKKEDEEKTKEFLEKARDIGDELQKMQEELVSQIIGTDIASAAREFAQSWLDAYLSFGNTTKAIKEKFTDLMKNLVVNMALAGAVERVLQPFFDAIDERAEDGELSSKDLAEIMDMVPQYVGNAVNAMDVAMKGLEKAGFDIQRLREGSSDLTGISRDIAGASEESITGLAAAIHTQNFYISQIHANVALIAQSMLSGNAASAANGGINVQELVTIQNEYLSHLPVMSSNIALTAARCERAAVACERMVQMWGRVITPKGGTTTYQITTNLVQ